jgi:NAD(P)-dependent dehydrogenase (short-subunit alcohol dehydrogenase family)
MGMHDVTDRNTKTVLVTGANSGFGLATVVQLAQLGFRSVGSVRSAAKVAKVTKAAKHADVSVQTVRLDVTDAEQSAAVIGKLRPWGLVNNAGYGGLGAMEDVSDDEARQQFETMVLAPLRLARLALPYMRSTGGGRVVNISSIYGRTTTPLSGWYQASKHALEAATDALRVEVARDNVKVVLIEPGCFKTRIWESLEQDVGHHTGSHYGPSYQRTQALVRAWTTHMGEPEDVARSVGKALTCASPRARYLVGPDAHMVAAVQPLIPTELRDRVTRLVTRL